LPASSAPSHRRFWSDLSDASVPARGALLFGMLADRFGRRPVLMANILGFSVIELACAFAPTLNALLILRALFGIAMGGVWGVGAALVFETLPREGRGTFSGILQEGYALGSILASAAFGLFFAGVHCASSGMYWCCPRSAGGAVHHGRIARAAGVLCAGARCGVAGVARGRQKAQDARHSARRAGLAAATHALPAHVSVSGGSDDGFHELFARHTGCVSHVPAVAIKLSPETIGLIGVLYGLGSIAGGIVFGALSETWGRKRAIITAALLALPVIPLYAYGHTAVTLGIGAVLMQFMVQGAWGVVPAYLTELSPARCAQLRRDWPTNWARSSLRGMERARRWQQNAGQLSSSACRDRRRGRCGVGGPDGIGTRGQGQGNDGGVKARVRPVLADGSRRTW